MADDRRDEFAPIADVYDLWSADMQADVPFYVSEAVEHGGPVLEVGAGTGRVSVAIARAGVPVVGIDLSPAMLARARARVEAEDLADRVELFEGDMRSFDLGRTFPLAILPYRVLAHALTPDDQVATLAAVRRHLEPNGRLVFNLTVPSMTDALPLDGLARDGRYRLDEGHDAVVWRQATYAPGTQRLTFHFVVDELDAGDEVTRRTHSEIEVRQCSPGEIEHALARAGFDLVDRWG
ncbi:MAG TPA: class I SAM-dependent methyltransferase, partial [Nitriliruptorales bacterium]